MAPRLSPRYGFRPVREADLPMIGGWLAEPHVAEWWGDKESELKGIAEHLDSIAVEPFVIELEGRPIGYIQSYDPYLEEGENPFSDQPFGTLGIDQFIGERKLIEKGHGTALILEFVQMLFAEGAPRVIVDPDPTNTRAIRAYEKAGFRRIDERATPFGEVLLMVRDAETGGT